MNDKLQAALARAEAAEAEVKRLGDNNEVLLATCQSELARATFMRDRWHSALAEVEAAERQRDEAWTAGAEAMREAIYNYVYDEAEAMKEQAYNLIEHHNFRPGGRGVSNEAKRKGFIRDRQQIAEKLFIDAAHIRTLPIPAQEK